MEALKEVLIKSRVSKARLEKLKKVSREVRGRVIKSCKRKISLRPRPPHGVPKLPPKSPIPPAAKPGAGGGTGPAPTPPTPTTGNIPQPQPSTGTPGSPSPDAGGALRPLEKNLVLLAVTRLSYGPAAGDFDRVTKMGFDAWLTEQLSPNQIDDSALEKRLASIPALAQTNAQLRDSKTISEQKRSLSAELLSATLLRAALSRRQLLQVMTEFWSDHFNVDISNKEGVLPLKFADDKGIRTHALGRFRDLLGHSAHSPAMLYYLDNRVNRGKSPNENYAREILELHTLGVNGGYSETDVKEVARCFTGWTVNQTTGEFMFDAGIHDNGSKTVLGRTIPSGGQQEVETVLDMLASHPSTARFIATKLCRKFISDTPSSTVIAQIAAVFTASQGSIAELIRAIAMRSEFGTSLGVKLRRPWDYMVSSLRALGAGLDNPAAVDSYIRAMDQFPFSWQPPTGYPDNAVSWYNASGLLARWNFAQALAAGRLSGITVNLQGLIGSANTAQSIVPRLEQSFLGRPLSTQSNNAITALLAAGQPPTQSMTAAAMTSLLPLAVGALLSSPEFQVK